ncbi:methyltransferase, putative [Plasmodium malariae]|uniref:mRNA (guanine-N(7))-methyltransferase n=1 Tax=Plasmodium malariae TaxID=5858 RepID=A0A1C3KL20_PLAMA|nr:methyltransferase, putative [Plasmodium malariae]
MNPENCKEEKELFYTEKCGNEYSSSLNKNNDSENMMILNENNFNDISHDENIEEGKKEREINKGQNNAEDGEEDTDSIFGLSSPPRMKKKKNKEDDNMFIKKQKDDRYEKPEKNDIVQNYEKHDREHKHRHRHKHNHNYKEEDESKDEDEEKKIIIDKNHLFHEINSLIKKKLNINDVIKIDIFYKDNCTQIKPYTLFDDYKHVNIENKVNIEIINFLKNSLKNNRKFINIHSSVVELRGTFNDELINLPIINQIILQKISNNNYKYKFNIDNEVLNYIYVDLFKIHKSKYKFKILEKKFEIEEWYYYDTKKKKRKGDAAEVNEGAKKGAHEEPYEASNYEKEKECKYNSMEEDEEHESVASRECNESDVLLNLYNEEKKKEEKNLTKTKKKKKKKKKNVDKDKLYIEKLKKLLEENSENESNISSNEKSSDDSDDTSNVKNQVLYKRKIIYSKHNDNTIINVFKEVENDTVCIYYPNSFYNQCLNLVSLEPISNNDKTMAAYASRANSCTYDMYLHKNKVCNLHNDAEDHAYLNILNEENIKIKKRYVRDISIYNFCCDEKYKGCSLFLHIAKNKKLKNLKIDYNINYSDFVNNYDIIKMYEIKKEDNSNYKCAEGKKINVGKLFELEKDWKVNVDMHIDIDKLVREFQKKYDIGDGDNAGKADNAGYAQLRKDCDKGGKNDSEIDRRKRTNKLDYIIYNFYKNFECLINFINKLKNSCTKFEYFYPKMIGDVNEEIRKHYDKKKVILLKKSNIKYIRIFNNEVKRIMILFFVSYDSKILDLACGHGQDMLKYNTVRNKVYVGLDISKKEIELAKERLNGNDMKGLCNNDNFLFLQGDILNNKFYRKWKNKNITFDIISINLALHYVIYNEKSSKKFFKIIENFLESEGILLATTISTITLADFLMKRPNIEIVNDTISLTLENDLFTIKFDQENLLKIFKNKLCLEEFIEFINSNSSNSRMKYDYFYNLIKDSLDNTMGIKYYFYLYDTIDANEFVIPQKYLKKKLQELNMVELFNNTAIMFLHYITNNLETYEKYQNIKYFNLINKTIDKHIFEDIKLRINKIHGYDRDSKIYYDICSLYHVYVYKKNFDGSILGII